MKLANYVQMTEAFGDTCYTDIRERLEELGQDKYAASDFTYWLSEKLASHIADGTEQAWLDGFDLEEALLNY
jgi:hypothetical protein